MSDAGLATVVAQHYNQLEEKGLEARARSRIFHLRNFNNWVKSMLIGDVIKKVRKERPEKINVLDIGSGKGGDLLKWKKAQIDYIICADVAATSVEQCHERYIEMKNRHVRQKERGQCFEAEFIAADCTKERLKEKYKNTDMQFDIVSCQFSFHYCFESLPQAKIMLKNVSESLKPGGYFIGTTTNCYEIMKRLNASSDCSFGNDVYSVKFHSKNNNPLFGAQYDFHLEGVVDCPEFLVYFPAFERLAADHGLKLLFRKRFDDYFEEFSSTFDGKTLLPRMQALEIYPPFAGQKLMGKGEDYSFAKKKVEEMKGKTDTDHGNEEIHVGTMSLSEWEAICMYVVFAFVKENPAGQENSGKEDSSESASS